jgi:hypothetical protein
MASGFLVELATSTAQLEATQSGRLVQGPPSTCGPFAESRCGPVLAHERDTLLSLLVGWGGPVEVKAGVSAILGKTEQGGFAYDDAAGHFAFTAAHERAIPIGDRLTVVPGVGYSFASRGHSAPYLGLGRHISDSGSVCGSASDRDSHEQSPNSRLDWRRATNLRTPAADTTHERNGARPSDESFRIRVWCRRWESNPHEG